MINISSILRFLWPKFYNRITWTVVLAGLALISSPLWETLLTAFLERSFDLTSYIPNEPVIGLILVGLGLAYNLGSHFLDISESRGLVSNKLQKHEEHDREIAVALLKLIPEDEFYYHLEAIGSDHSCNDAQYNFLASFVRHGMRTENQFLSNNIQIKQDVLAEACDKITTFIVTHFFPMGQNSGRTYMYPECNVDRKGTGTREQNIKYTRYTKELIELVQAAREAYEELRKLIKIDLAM